MGLLAPERYQIIVSHLARSGRARLSDLRRELGISSASLRRDAAELEARGLVVRVHGGLMHPAHLPEPSLSQRQRAAQPCKRAIAVAAAALVGPGQTVFIDGGSTCLQVGRLLSARRDVTLVTNSLALAYAAQSGEAPIVLLGGRVRAISGTLVGAEALGALKRLSADWAFVGASGLTAEGASTPELEEAAIKRAWIARARQRAVVADSSKWDRPATVCFAAWRDLGRWIADSGLPRAVVRDLQSAGVEVILARAESRPEGMRKGRTGT